MTLNEIIKIEFQNASVDQVVKLLAENNLYDCLIKTIDKVNYHLNNKDGELNYFGILNVAPIASTLLIRINEYFRILQKENNRDQQQHLEYILGNITKRILINVIKNVPASHKQKQLLAIHVALSETCDLFNYDFEKLSQFLQIDDLIIEVYATWPNENENEKVITPNSDFISLPGFSHSLMDPEDIPKLIDIFISEDITSDRENLNLLFNNPKENLSIQFNEKKKKYVLQFLAVLKNSKLITHYNCTGFYLVLSCHVKNFDEVFLNGKTAQRRIDAVKKLKDWEQNKNRFEGLLKKLVIPCHST